jgi:hypothetical protein
MCADIILKPTLAEVAKVNAFSGQNSSSGLFDVGAGIPPDLLEDFSTYTSTANMLSDPRGIYTAEDVNTGDMQLDTSEGFGASSQSMRYDYPDRTLQTGSRCNDYTIGRNLDHANLTEVWYHIVAKFASNFHTEAPAGWSCGSNPDLKWVFGRVNGGSGRFEWKIGTFGGSWSVGYPGNAEAFQTGGASVVWDGLWHDYKMRFRVAPGGAATAQARFIRDNVELWDSGNIVVDRTDIWSMAMGRNLNQGPEFVMSMWWGLVEVYYSNPGW